jgi:hypothetical protein
MSNLSSWLGSSTACGILRRLVVPLIAGALLFPLAGSADKSDLITGNRSVTAPPPPPQPQKPDAPINCAQPHRDARCRPTTPDYRPYPYSRQSTIIYSEPAAAPIDISELHDDWEGCRSAKLDAIHSRNAGHLDQANRLDEWLWKNCRSYSEELRDLE